MLEEKELSTGGATATMTFELNNEPVKISVKYAGNQVFDRFTLACVMSSYGYYVGAYTGDESINFYLFTQTIAVGEYKYPGTYGEMQFMDHNGISLYVQDPTDYLQINVTSIENGRISGTVSGRFSPLVAAGPITNSYGPAGSYLLTNGTFKDLPVLD